MDLEITIFSEVSQTYKPLKCEILKNDTNELIYKTETDTDIGNKLRLPKRKGEGELIRRLELTYINYCV